MSDRPIVFTVYPNKTTTRGVLQSRPWEEWVEILTTHIIRPEKDGPAAVLGEIPTGKARKGEHVERVHALGIDVEKHTEERVSELLDVLAPFEFVIYTTHRNGTESTPRVRIILPLAEPISPEGYSVTWARLNMLSGGINDPSTKDVGRLHFLPSAPNYDHAWAARNTGRFITVDDLPAHLQPVAAARATLSKAAIRAALDKLIKRTKHGMSKEDPIKAGTLALIKGEPFAPEGERHEFILELTWWIASNMPETPIEAVVELFTPSLSKMDTDQSPNDVRNAYLGALAKVDEFRKDQEQERKRRTHEVQLAGQEAYTPEDLKSIAAVQEVDLEELQRRWIVQRDSTFYFLKADGYYSTPCSFMEARPAASHILARAPVLLNEPTKTSVRRRSIIELVEDYGVKADNVVGDLTLQHTVYEARTSTLREAVCPRRDLEPHYDERIDNWLRVLGGSQYDKLLDWLAVFPDLSKLLCALYVAGKAGSGKSLLPVGLAKLWTEGGPTKIEKVLENYNEALSKCPLIWADEAIPKKWKGNPTTTVLRSIISETTRALSRKYRSEATLNGAVRVILSANNEFLLQDSDDAPGLNDRQAISQRFLYLDADEAVAAHVVKIERQFSIQKEWIDNAGIARHVLYLASKRAVKQQGRFWVMGTESTMSRRLAVGGSDWNQWVCEWLVRYLVNPNPVDAKRDGRVRRGEGELLINAQAISDGWNIYLKLKRDPDTHRIGAALAAISLTDDGKKGRVQRRWNGAHVWYHRIDLENLVDWSNRNGIGDEETIRASVLRETPPEPAAKSVTK